MPGRLEGQVALVLGAGSAGEGWGNGKASAVLYAREGARVVAGDLHQAAAEETCALIEAEGGTALALAADVTCESDVAEIVAHALEWGGRIDLLHNNVGVTDMGELHEMDEGRWRQTLDANLTSAFLACKHVLPSMLRQEKGAIVNTSSLAGIRVNAYPYFGYYASKAGLNHLTRAIAVHYASRGVRCNAVLPGVMDTPLIHSQITGQYASKAAMLAARHAMSPMGRMGDAWDVARAALFLASNDAGYITGVCLPVDGGLSCVTR